MAIETKCRCGANFRAKHELSGKRVKCPQCGQPIMIPTLDDDDPLGSYELGSELLASSVAFPESDTTSTENAATQLPAPTTNPEWGKTQTNDRTAAAAKEQPQPTAEPTSMTVSTVYAIAIVSYLSLVGWVVAVILHYKSDSRNTSFGAFHLRQSLGIHLTGFFLGLPPLIIRAAGGEDFAWLISYMFYPISLLLFVVWILGLISVFQSKEEEVPVVGEGYQKLFHFIN